MGKFKKDLEIYELEGVFEHITSSPRNEFVL